MDGRLYLVLGGKRLNHLLGPDLPALAKAILCVLRGHGRAATATQYNVPYARLWGKGFEVYVRFDDWAKILPYLADGSLNDLVTPSVRLRNRNVPIEVADIDVLDRPMFDRILGLLKRLFPDDYPNP